MSSNPATAPEAGVSRPANDEPTAEVPVMTPEVAALYQEREQLRGAVGFAESVVKLMQDDIVKKRVRLAQIDAALGEGQ